MEGGTEGERGFAPWPGTLSVVRGRVATGQQVAWPVVAVDLFWPVAVVIVVVVAVVVVAVVARFSNCPLNARRVSKTITRRLGPLR